MTTAMTLSIAEIEAQPSLLVDLILKLKDVGFTIKSAGDELMVYPQRRYSKEVLEILQESEALYLKRKIEGYTREQAFEDFMQVQREIGKVFAQKNGN